MPLTMARPWKHPKTGIYWIRKGVPEDLRALVGKREEKRSLETRDPDEAKRRHAEALAEIEARWANLRTGPKSLTEREAHAMAAAVHDRWLEIHADNPSQQVFWRTDLMDRLWAPQPTWDVDVLLEKTIQWHFDPDTRKAKEQEPWCEKRADECLAARGLIVDEASRLKLAKAVAAAVQRASIV